MRTQEQFQAIMHQVKWWHRFHKKPVWLIALEDRYTLSVVKPTPKELAHGTVAVLYGLEMEMLDRVESL